MPKFKPIDFASHPLGAEFAIQEYFEKIFPNSTMADNVDVDTSLPGPAPYPSSSSEKSSGTKVRESLLTIIVGMAVDKYGFDPHQKRNTATRSIQESVLALGLSLDEDTIRKYLKEAAELIPGDALESLKR